MAVDPLCLFCRLLGIVAPGAVVDHVHPPRGDYHLQRNPDNLQVLCTSHHAFKTAWEQGDTKRPLQLGMARDGWAIEWSLPSRPKPREQVIA